QSQLAQSDTTPIEKSDSKHSPAAQTTETQPVAPATHVLSEETEPSNPRRLPSCSSPLGRGIREGLSTLTIENGTELDAFVKVFKVSGGRLLIRNLFIVAGKTCTSDSVPAGEYVLLTAFGKDWDASTKKFNFRRSFAETQRFEVTEEQV